MRAKIDLKWFIMCLQYRGGFCDVEGGTLENRM